MKKSTEYSLPETGSLKLLSKRVNEMMRRHGPDARVEFVSNHLGVKAVVTVSSNGEDNGVRQA